MGKTNFSTYLAIKHQLLELLRQNQFEQNRLPSESVLAQMMGVSLVTLRESLMMLALEGYITKHHGSGNYMHRSTLDYENRSIFYAECLAAEGHQVEVKTLSRRILTPEPELQEKLGLSPEQNVFRAEVIFYSDGLPAIWVENNLPEPNLLRKDIENFDFSRLHGAIWEFCQRALAHSLNEYLPTTLPQNVAETFDYPADKPVIECLQLFYDVHDAPVLFSKSYFYPGRYHVRTLQNWALNQE